MHWEIKIKPEKSIKLLKEEVELMNMIVEAEKTGTDPDTLYFKRPFGSNISYSHFKELLDCRDRWDDINNLAIRRNLIMHSYIVDVGKDYASYTRFLKRWKCDESIIPEDKFNECCNDMENRSSKED